MCTRLAPFCRLWRPDWHLLKEKQLFIIFCFNQVCYYFFLLEGIWVLLVLFCLGRQILTITKPNGGAIQFLYPPQVSHNLWFTSRLNTNEERARGAGCSAANSVTGGVASASSSFATSTSWLRPPLLCLMAWSQTCDQEERDAISPSHC